ncbi:MAG: undecaprenyl-diphosphate phosphatase [Erysipelotrichaceae bacterium]|nr:undecaprenyl-diphosphate phosphatase [Erysipelotrichaceae bacterium]
MINPLNLLKAVLFGIVEGITEWLPISSTGHMILLNEFVKLDVTPEFYSVFEVVIQLGAILAVVVLFWNRLWPFRAHAVNPKGKGIFRYVDAPTFDMWLKIIVACLPAAIIGITLGDFFESLFYNPYCVAIALIVFGVGFIVVENRNKDKTPRINSIASMNGATAVKIGLWQVIAAVFPGTSRSGTTILGALMMGVSRTAATEFTFFLAIPVMAGASLLKLIKYGFHFQFIEVLILLIGMVTAFVTSLFVIRAVLNYIKTHDFKIFGYYRIVLGLIVLFFFLVFR